MKKSLFILSASLVCMTSCSDSNDVTPILGDSCSQAQYIVFNGTKCTDKTCEFETIAKHGKCPMAAPVCAEDADNAAYCHEICAESQVFCGLSCIDPMTSNEYCGAKAGCADYEACTDGKTCRNGHCVKAERVDCGADGFVDPMTNHDHCGNAESCDSLVKCSDTQSCIQGVCHEVCPETQVFCNEACIDPMTSNEYCGAKAGCADYEACADGKSCRGGHCVETARVDCGADGFVDPMTNHDHCGNAESCDGLVKCESDQSCIEGICTDNGLGDACAEAQYLVSDGQKCTDESCDFDAVEKYGKCPGTAPVCAADAENNAYCHEICAETQVFCELSCIDPMSSDEFCGAKAGCTGYETCAEGTACHKGFCVESARVDCGADGFIDPLRHNDHCGTSDKCEELVKCEIGEACIEGACSKCLDFTDREIELFAYKTWDINHDRCISASEAALVTEIPAKAFRYNNKIKDLSDLALFTNLKKIGDNAFERCTSLTTIQIDSITEIGKHAFDNAENIVSVHMPNLTAIEEGAFYQARSLQYFDSPKLETIGESAFYSTGLILAEFDNVTTVGEKAFYLSSSLISVNLPKAVSIGKLALCGNGNIRTIRLTSPDKITVDPEQFGDGDYKNISERIDLVLHESQTGIAENTWNGSTWKSVSTRQDSCMSFTDAEIKNFAETNWDGAAADKCITTGDADAVTEIRDNAFMNNKEVFTLDDLQHFANLKTIGAGAFKNCTNLHTAHLPQITQIKANAFENAENLRDVDFSGISKIEDHTFRKTGLVNPDFSAVTEIGTGAFYNCPNLQNPNFSKVTTIGNDAFSSCMLLKEPVFNELTTIGEYAFADCRQLQISNFDKTVSLGKKAFSNCSSLTTPSFAVLTSLANSYGAFDSCISITGIDLSKVQGAIPGSLFSNCTSLKTVDMKQAVSLSNGVFQGCSSLEDVDLSKVESIDFSAFIDCRSLKTLKLPSVTKLDDNVFSGCSALTDLQLTANVDWTNKIIETTADTFANFSDSKTKFKPENATLTFTTIPDTVQNNTWGGVTWKEIKAAAAN